jgi:DNA-binding XRE family transcriptional regulator
MSEKKMSSDAVAWMYNRYIKGKPEREGSLEKIRRQGDLAQRIYDIRHRLRMTREDLAEFAGLTPETIEDIEESDYDGDWKEAVGRINDAFRRWFGEVIVPASQMKPEEYFVRSAGGCAPSPPEGSDRSIGELPDNQAAPE